MLYLSKALYGEILAHAQSELPNEACGLIAGQAQTAGKVYPLTNLDHSPEHFSLDPREQLAALKDARAQGLQIIGNFHSHPASPARPSQEDIRLAYDPHIFYLILSLAEEVPVLKAFRIEGQNVTQEEMTID